MPKFDWDAFAGGVAAGGVPAFSAVSNASLGNREMRNRELISAYKIGGNAPIIQEGGPSLGGVANRQLGQQAGVTQDAIVGYDSLGGIGAAPAAPEPGMGDAQSRQVGGGRLAMGGRLQELFNNASDEEKEAVIAGAEENATIQKQTEIMDWLWKYDNLMQSVVKKKNEWDQRKKRVSDMEAALAVTEEVAQGLNTVGDIHSPVPPQLLDQLSQAGIRVAPGMTVDNALRLMNEHRALVAESLKSERNNLVQGARELKMFEPEVNNFDKMFQTMYGIPPDIMQAYKDEWIRTGIGAGPLGKFIIEHGTGQTMRTKKAQPKSMRTPYRPPTMRR